MTCIDPPATAGGTDPIIRLFPTYEAKPWIVDTLPLMPVKQGESEL